MHNCAMNTPFVVPVILDRLFFFNDTATTEIYTLSLHDALPISDHRWQRTRGDSPSRPYVVVGATQRSEEHTSELQSRLHLVCRLLLEQKKMELTGDDRVSSCCYKNKEVAHGYA